MRRSKNRAPHGVALVGDQVGRVPEHQVVDQRDLRAHGILVRAETGPTDVRTENAVALYCQAGNPGAPAAYSGAGALRAARCSGEVPELLAPPRPFHVEVGVVLDRAADGAVVLDVGPGVADGGVGRDHLGRAALEPGVGPPAVGAQRRVSRLAPGRLGPDGHVGAPVLHCLEGTDRLPNCSRTLANSVDAPRVASAMPEAIAATSNAPSTKGGHGRSS